MVFPLQIVTLHVHTAFAFLLSPQLSFIAPFHSHVTIGSEMRFTRDSVCAFSSALPAGKEVTERTKVFGVDMASFTCYRLKKPHMISAAREFLCPLGAERQMEAENSCIHKMTSLFLKSLVFLFYLTRE